VPYRRLSGATRIRGAVTARTAMAAQRLRAAAERHPQIVDAVFAVLLGGLSARITANTGGTTGYGWFWFIALHLPLVWRRRWPRSVLAPWGHPCCSCR
jgi:hypothetical protein